MTTGHPLDALRRTLFVLIAFAVVLLGWWALGGKKPNPSEDRAAIQEVLDKQVAAWNKGDLDGFMEGYWNSPELSFSSGADNKRGWQATYDRYRAKYQSQGSEMGKLTFSELEIDLLSSESAVVRGRFQLVMSKGNPSGLFTLIFKKLPEGWRIVHDHTSG
jgi:beta-aspartyl-peptidase (threonine type)